MLSVIPLATAIGYIVGSFVLSVAIYKLQTRKKAPGAAEAKKDEFRFPTSAEDRFVPVAWGTVRQKAPNAIWAGGYLSDANFQNINGTGSITSYNYCYGTQLALCRGPIDSVTGVWVDDRKVWPGVGSDANDETADDPVALTYSDYHIDTEVGQSVDTVSLAVFTSGFRGILKVGKAGEAGCIVPAIVAIYGYQYTFTSDEIAVISEGKWEVSTFTTGVDVTAPLYYGSLPFSVGTLTFQVKDLNSTLPTGWAYHYSSRGHFIDAGVDSAARNGFEYLYRTRIAPGLTDDSVYASTVELQTNKSNLQESWSHNQLLYVRDRGFFVDKNSSTDTTGTGSNFRVTSVAAGGIEMLLHLNTGLDAGSQVRTPYMETLSPGTEAVYGGTATVQPFADTPYMGRSTQIPAITFEVQRFPRNLTLSEDVAVIGLEANPAEVLYECLTNTEWGLSVPPGRIDYDSFRNAALTLASEGNGYSRMLTEPDELDAVISDLEAQIDGTVFEGRDGRFRLRLIRDDYNKASLRRLDESNIISVDEFARQSYDTTANSVYVEFDDRSRDYEGSVATAHDPASIIATARNQVNRTERLRGVKTMELAEQIATRSLRLTSTPLATCKLTVDSSLFDIEPGEPVILNSNSHGLRDTVFRVTSINLGTASSSEIELTMMQDVFGSPSTRRAVNLTSDVEATYGTPISAFDPAHQYAEEAPKRLLDVSTDSTPHRIMTAGGKVSQATAYSLYVDGANDRTVLYVSQPATLDQDLGIEKDLVTGVINLSVIGADAQFEQDFVSNPDHSQLENLIVIGDELMLVTGAQRTETGVQLRGVYRGVLDTVQTTHSEGDPVFILKPNSSVTTSAYTTAPDGLYDVNLLPRAGASTVPIGDTTTMQVVMRDRYYRPLPPSILALNNEKFPNLVSSSLLSREAGALLYINRRSWRESDVVGQLIHDAGELDNEYPAQDAANHTVKVEGKNADGTWTTVGTYDMASSNEVQLASSDVLVKMGTLLQDDQTMRYTVTANHTVHDDVGQNPYTSLQDLVHECLVDFGLRGTTNMGSMFTDAYGAGHTATATEDLVISSPFGALPTNYSVTAKINGGAASTVIASGGSSGSVSVTSGDVLTLAVTYTGGTAPILEEAYMVRVATKLGKVQAWGIWRDV